MPALEDPVPDPPEHLRDLRTRDQFFLSCFWFAYNFHWGALLAIVLPSQITAIVGDKHKELFNGLIPPLGATYQDVAELISGPRFKEILRESREMFDYIIVDAPPLGIFTDATVLINQADGALLVVRANRTRFSAIDRILDPLPKDRLLGVVLNQSEDVMEETHYNYGYYNYKRLGESPTP